MDIMENLINCFDDYKTMLEYQNLDFDTDNPLQTKGRCEEYGPTKLHINYIPFESTQCLSHEYAIKFAASRKREKL